MKKILHYLGIALFGLFFSACSTKVSFIYNEKQSNNLGFYANKESSLINPSKDNFRIYVYSSSWRGMNVLGLFTPWYVITPMVLSSVDGYDLNVNFSPVLNRKGGLSNLKHFDEHLEHIKPETRLIVDIKTTNKPIALIGGTSSFLYFTPIGGKIYCIKAEKIIRSNQPRLRFVGKKYCEKAFAKFAKTPPEKSSQTTSQKSSQTTSEKPSRRSWRKSLQNRLNDD